MRRLGSQLIPSEIAPCLASQDRASRAFDCRPVIGRFQPNESCTLYGARRFLIECLAPSTTIFLAMKNTIIFISALSLVAMILASCESIFAPDETATTHVTTSQTNDAPRERSAEDSVNSISGGHY